MRERTKGMTLGQELAFWQERSRIFKQRQEVTKGESHAQAEEEKQQTS